MKTSSRRSQRPAGAAVEFVLVASILFVLFLGMIEVGRAMMVLGAVGSAARSGARSGAVPSGDYSAITTAVNNSLGQSLLAGATTTVTVNGTAVQDDTTFNAAVSSGAAISVSVSINYQQVSWLPAGTALFLSANQPLSETAVMRREN